MWWTINLGKGKKALTNLKIIRKLYQTIKQLDAQQDKDLHDLLH